MPFLRKNETKSPKKFLFFRGEMAGLASPAPGGSQEGPTPPAAASLCLPWAITSSEPNKAKSAQAFRIPSGTLHGSGAGRFGRWRRRFDIHDRFLFAPLAQSRQIPDERIWSDFQKSLISADWANSPSILYDQFTSFALALQYFRLLFFSVGELTHCITSILIL